MPCLVGEQIRTALGEGIFQLFGREERGERLETDCASIRQSIGQNMVYTIFWRGSIDILQLSRCNYSFYKITYLLIVWSANRTVLIH